MNNKLTIEQIEDKFEYQFKTWNPLGLVQIEHLIKTHEFFYPTVDLEYFYSKQGKYVLYYIEYKITPNNITRTLGNNSFVKIFSDELEKLCEYEFLDYGTRDIAGHQYPRFVLP